MDIGKRLRELREERSMSQIRLSEISGVSRRTIGSVELGDCLPVPDTIHRLADALDLPTETLSELLENGSPIQKNVVEKETVIGTQLRKLRKERSLSQRGLAKLSGVGYRHIGVIEKGRTLPTPSIIYKLAKALDLPTETLSEWLQHSYTPQRKLQTKETSFGSRLRKLREERSLSPFALSKISGISRTNIGRIERGLVILPTSYTIFKLAEGLEVHPSKFFEPS